MEDSLKLITKRLKLDFNAEDVSLDSIDFDALENELDKGHTVDKTPIMLKYTDDGYILVTFAIKTQKNKVGFGS